jgi:hypothetical protein
LDTVKLGRDLLIQRQLWAISSLITLSEQIGP